MDLDHNHCLMPLVLVTQMLDILVLLALVIVPLLYVGIMVKGKEPYALSSHDTTADGDGS